MAPPLTFPFEVLDATGCLHQRGILHRDLATKNVLPGKPKWKVSQQKLKTWESSFWTSMEELHPVKWRISSVEIFTFDGVYGSFWLLPELFCVWNQLAVTCKVQPQWRDQSLWLWHLARGLWSGNRETEINSCHFFALRSGEVNEWPMNFGPFPALMTPKSQVLLFWVGKDFRCFLSQQILNWQLDSIFEKRQDDDLGFVSAKAFGY